MTSRTRRFIVGAALAAVPALLITHESVGAATTVAVARFHLALSKAEPAVNGTVAASPKVIKLWFTETVQVAATGIQILGAGDHMVALGTVTLAAAPKSPAIAEIKEALKPGKYTVNWKTLAADGHPNKGTFMFTISGKAAR